MKINRIQNYLIFNVILVLSLITSACSKETKHFNELDCNNEEINDHTAAIFIIPEVGCGTCIANGINFLKENEEIFKTNRDRYLIVLSNIHSLKMVKRTLNKYSICTDSMNIIYDIDNRYKLHGKYKLYPTIFYIENKKVINVESQSPDNNNALNKFQQFIDKQK